MKDQKNLPYIKTYFHIAELLEEVGPLAWAVYTALQMHRNRFTKQCNPSVDTLAKKSKQSRNCVIKSLKILVGRGLVIKHRRFNATTQYELPDFPVCQRSTPRGLLKWAVSPPHGPLHSYITPRGPRLVKNHVVVFNQLNHLLTKEEKISKSYAEGKSEAKQANCRHHLFQPMTYDEVEYCGGCYAKLGRKGKVSHG